MEKVGKRLIEIPRFATSPELIITYDTVRDNNLTFIAFAQSLIAMQKIVEYSIKSENKDATVPIFEIDRISEGSIAIHALLGFAQKTLGTLAPSILSKVGEGIKNAFSPYDEISSETKTSIKIPKHILRNASQPVLDNMVKSITGRVAGKEESLFCIDSSNTVQLQSFPILETKSELFLTTGDDINCEGELRSIDWDKKTCKLKTQLGNQIKKYTCVIADTKFLTQSVKDGMMVKVIARPIYKENAFGEKSIKSLELINISEI